MSETPLFSSEQEREKLESLAEVYSLIVALDQVEKAFIRDSVTQEEYTEACSRLLGQYATLLKNKQVEQEFQSIDAFSQKYNIRGANGIERIRAGIPATVEIGVTPVASTRGGNLNSGVSTPQPESISARAVAEVTSLFITAMDGLKLNYRTKDALHPILSDLVTGLNKVVGPDYTGRAKLVEWLITLNGMKINEELSDEQVRQCLFDIEALYKDFFHTLQ